MAGNQVEHVEELGKYITIAKQQITWEQVIKKSRFIVNIARVSNEEEAKQFIDSISLTHRKATHNVWAYLLGDRNEIQRYSDNGEPAGTAGVPMLEVLKNNAIRDVAVVVTRYFGGIKLGAGGLVRAYAGTVVGGVEASGLIERIQRHEVRLQIAYKQLDPLKYWLGQNDYQILDTAYASDVTITVAVADSEMTAFKQAVTDEMAGQVQIVVGNINWYEIPYTNKVHAKTETLK
ncbi:YigZ family protein [Weissella thailandensis]|uniref:YigZ family protein n=1 Tax=Weissella thailandensis TaxID=89061 RepID=UPI0011922C53|nr:YigZ family protein [Weissella thailandensis]GEP74854.1 YigZ family protein [Weissella thailandensis]